MSDLIERDKAYEVIANYFDQIGYSRRYAKALINKVPSARPQGEWIEVEEDWRHQIEFWKCSECEFAVSSMYNYCPNCGARMKGADDD